MWFVITMALGGVANHVLNPSAGRGMGYLAIAIQFGFAFAFPVSAATRQGCVFERAHLCGIVPPCKHPVTYSECGWGGVHKGEGGRAAGCILRQRRRSCQGEPTPYHPHPQLSEIGPMLVFLEYHCYCYCYMVQDLA